MESLQELIFETSLRGHHDYTLLLGEFNIWSAGQGAGCPGGPS